MKFVVFNKSPTKFKKHKLSCELVQETDQRWMNKEKESDVISLWTTTINSIVERSATTANAMILTKKTKYSIHTKKRKIPTNRTQN